MNGKIASMCKQDRGQALSVTENNCTWIITLARGVNPLANLQKQGILGASPLYCITLLEGGGEPPRHA
jgi:hypothetical protein